MTLHIPPTILPNDILFDRYQVLSAIGQGGMALVYKVFDQVEQRVVALKVLSSSKDKLQRSVERFRKEFSAMQRLSHPYIVSAYNFHETEEGQTGFSMELVEGQDLDSMIHREVNNMSMAERLLLLQQIAEGLLHAHEQNLIHRDLKPANILVHLESGGALIAKITDFGLTQDSSEGADMTKSSNQIGTAYYMAPEQHRGEVLSVHTDIYSFGILAFELFTGQRPFDGRTPYSLFLAHVSKGLPELKSLNPEIPTWVSTMVEICAEKDKKHRYKSMKEVVALIHGQKDKKTKGFLSFLSA